MSRSAHVLAGSCPGRASLGSDRVRPCLTDNSTRPQPRLYHSNQFITEKNMCDDVSANKSLYGNERETPSIRSWSSSCRARLRSGVARLTSGAWLAAGARLAAGAWLAAGVVRVLRAEVAHLHELAHLAAGLPVARVVFLERGRAPLTLADSPSSPRCSQGSPRPFHSVPGMQARRLARLRTHRNPLGDMQLAGVRPIRSLP
jgi:hypothetical protein